MLRWGEKDRSVLAGWGRAGPFFARGGKLLFSFFRGPQEKQDGEGRKRREYDRFCQRGENKKSHHQREGGKGTTGAPFLADIKGLAVDRGKVR